MTTHSVPSHSHRHHETDSGAFFKVAAVLLGLLVSVLGMLALLMWADARKSDGATEVAQSAQNAAAPHSATATGGATPSFAGVMAENADELAAKMKPYDARLPKLQPGPVAKINMTVKDQDVEIAPGVKYKVWSFDGTGVPGPIVHVREGQTVKFTITNGGSIPHSMDFHAARIAPNKAFTDVMPGESFSFSFKANDPGVFMYHCGTKPVLSHIANGMYGAIVVSPKKALPKADNEYVLVGSEFYLNGDGIAKPAEVDMGKATRMQPDWMTFNGYASQYATHPLTAKPGETTRFYVVASGPTENVNFHVVGTVFDRVWVNGDVTNAPQQGVQTVLVPAGGGGIFDVTIPGEGTYPFVSHAFAHVQMGQVGILKVGDPKTTMTH